MNQRTQYALLMLQQIGLPLLRSLATTPPSGADAVKEGTLMADLLGRSTEYGTHIGRSLDLTEAENKNKSLRIALAALGAQIIALHRDQSGKIPADNEAKRFFSALESVLSFSDQFTPDGQALGRLGALSADLALFDGQQIQIHYLMAFLPVLQAVGGFSFGIAEGKLAKDISGRITDRAAALRESLLGSALDGQEAKLADLMLVRMLAALYADCHRAQTQRLTKLGESDRAAAGMDVVWGAFETRVNMLEALGESFLPKRNPASANTRVHTAQATPEPSWDDMHPLPPAAPDGGSGGAEASFANENEQGENEEGKAGQGDAHSSTSAASFKK